MQVGDIVTPQNPAYQEHGILGVLRSVRHSHESVCKVHKELRRKQKDQWEEGKFRENAYCHISLQNV